MAKATIEVEVVRYFETAPIESAEIVYRIISDKMRERLGTTGKRARQPRRPQEGSAKHSSRPNRNPVVSDEAAESGSSQTGLSQP